MKRTVIGKTQDGKILERTGFSFKDLPFRPHHRREFADLVLSYTAQACGGNRRESEEKSTSLGIVERKHTANG